MATKHLKKNLQARWPPLSLRVAASCPAAGAAQRPTGYSTQFQAYTGISLVDPDPDLMESLDPYPDSMEPLDPYPGSKFATWIRIQERENGSAKI